MPHLPSIGLMWTSCSISAGSMLIYRCPTWTHRDRRDAIRPIFRRRVVNLRWSMGNNETFLNGAFFGALAGHGYGAVRPA
jgi:hypothetical protein